MAGKVQMQGFEVYKARIVDIAARAHPIVQPGDMLRAAGLSDPDSLKEIDNAVQRIEMLRVRHSPGNRAAEKAEDLREAGRDLHILRREMQEGEVAAPPEADSEALAYIADMLIVKSYHR